MYTLQESFIQLFEEQVHIRPDSVAITFQDTFLTYSELHKRSNQLAHYLRQLGAGPEILVGICVERSLEMVVGILGVLKAGAAYVPLDPHYPTERLAFMLHDAQIRFLLTQHHLSTLLPVNPVSSLFLDSHWSAIAQMSEADLPCFVDADNLAYVIYTSGSTGRPKGVSIEYRGLNNLAHAELQAFHIKHTDRIVQFASLSFDASVFEMVMALTSGAVLCLGSQGDMLPGTDLQHFLEKQQITIATLPPSVVALLPLTISSLHTIIAAGEALPNEVVTRVDGTYRLFNAYGPTEATVWAALAECHADAQRIRPPIGLPIFNVEVYVLDAQLQMVAAGDVGELYIGGIGLARGYLNRPDLTAERFIPHPFSEKPGARLHKTGDLARSLPGGQLECLDRIDLQVKVRGFRLDLNEIEAVLDQYPPIEQSLVALKEDEPENSYLIAYIIPQAAQHILRSALQAYLQLHLPHYMIPSGMVLLEKFPLLPNGKIDRRALLNLSNDKLVDEENDDRPRTPVEEMLSQLWADQFKLSRVGLHDSFFLLGGHSLIAAQIMKKINDLFHVEISLQAFFAKPTIAELAIMIDAALTDESEQQLTPLHKFDYPETLPLALTQTRLWFLDQLEAARPAYIVPVALRLQGPLSISVLRQSIALIVERHEILRTSFPDQDGQPHQLILPPPRTTLEVCELESLPQTEKQARVNQIIAQRIRQPFDVSQGPLFSALLFCLAREEHVLLLRMHHLVIDDWSIAILLQELATLYNALVHDEPVPLAALPVQFADFALWQQSWLQGDFFAKQAAYWKHQLQNHPPLLTLPVDYPRPAIQSFRGAVQYFDIPQEIARQLRTLGQQTQTTLFMICLTAFHVLLSRYSGQSDISIGTPIANRPRAELDDLIGFFANTVVLRLQSSKQKRFREFLQQARETIVEAYANQYLPFDHLYGLLRVERDISYNPLFQVMMLFQNVDQETENISLSNLSIERLALDNETTQCDLILEITETGQGLKCLFRYCADLFDATTISRMSGHFQNLLVAIAADPESILAELPLLTAEEYRTLESWNATGVPYPLSACLHHLIEAQVEQHQEEVAVIFEGVQLTYRELNQRSNQVAHYLRTLGVEPERLVGIYMERSLEMIIGILGVLKAGGAYVPLDPTYPQERLRFMAADAGISVLLTQRELLVSLPPSDAVVVCLDDSWPMLEMYSETNPVSGVQPANLLYVIYTSGSTGRPKGVMNTHQALCNRLLWMQDAYHLTSVDRVLQKTSFSFDVSVWEFFWPLLNGACLVIAPPNVQRDSQGLLDLIVQRSITTLHFVPSMLQIFLDTPGIEQCSSLRQVFCSGEALGNDLQQRFFAAFSAKLHNLYGPTEAAIDVTFWECRRESELSYVPVGRPIANTQAYILDFSGQPAPIGVAGELCIGGVGLARGYLNNPDLTARSFIPDPFSHQEGSRLYKTGDLACYQPGGIIKFLGRIDHQIKLRGFRIETEEVETILASHPLVKASIVAVKEDQQSGLLLVAYVVVGMEAPGDWQEQLRTFLRRKLPEYMVPNAFVSLAAFPLTQSGKINRAALPDPASRQREKYRAKLLPGNYIEQGIADIWRDILQIDHIGVHDNFFDLGGHSLLIIQVQRELNKRLQIDLSVTELFTYPTLSTLAAYLARKTSTNIYSWQDETREDRDTYTGAVAIIGMAGRFPGARDLAAFWQNLRNGVESISFFTDEELIAAGIDPTLLQFPRYVRASAIIEDADLFAASFFGYSPREAEIMDPQQRLLLECAWEALEHAGYCTETYLGSIGVYAGLSMSTYFLANLYANPQIERLADQYQMLLANDKDYLATRISYKLNLRGPSMTIQTACSTSLVAVQTAYRSLLNQECDMALAGGCCIRVPQKVGYIYQEGGIASPDGHCRAFDARAQGAVGGDGLGLVVLKRLEDAYRDGDTIHAIIRGAAINNDGAGKVGYTAPGVQGQAQAIRSAIDQANVPAETITYIEAHGTATPLGDPIEIAALQQAYKSLTRKSNFCALGSVKTNIGHLDAAAGIAGLLKTVLALKHQEIPPSLHFETLNPHIDLADSPFYVNSLLTHWPSTDIPRRAGVSSFGIGGTNAHVILEEALEKLPETSEAQRLSDPWQLLVLSAKTNSALEAMTTRLLDYIQEHPDLLPDDVAYTLQVGRNAFEYRRVIVCQSLSQAASTPAFTGRQKESIPPVAFLFPGQGTQYVGMARELYEYMPVFRSCIDQCADFLSEHSGIDLRMLLYPEASQQKESESKLKNTQFTQIALFSVEYALAQLFASWGIKPQAMIGHSIGEYVAACLAQVFSLEDALTLVVARGQIMQQMSEGAMLAIFLSEKETRELLSEDLSLAAVNAPRQCVVSGTIDAVARLIQDLDRRGIVSHRLVTSHAFHSHLTEPVLQAFASQVQQVELRAPTIPYLSNLTGTWITPEQATDPAYWIRHMRECVCFAQGLQTLLQDLSPVLLEVGPGETLTVLARQNAQAAHISMLSSLPGARTRASDLATVYLTSGHLWLQGIAVNWTGLHAHKQRKHIPLPSYPFERQRYWIEPGKITSPTIDVQGQKGQIVKNLSLDNWLYLSEWNRSPLPPGKGDELSVALLACCLVFRHDETLTQNIVRSLREQAYKVIEVVVGDRFAKLSDERYMLDPHTPADYVALMQDLQFMGNWPQKIVHGWSILSDTWQDSRMSQELGFYSLLYLTQAATQCQDIQPFHIWILSNNIQAVTGSERILPEKATIGGISKVIPQEYAFITCSSIDIVAAAPESWQEQRQYSQLLSEILAPPLEAVVAYRGDQRWVQTYKPVRLDASPQKISWIRQGGTYLLVGGLGQMGLTIARHLAHDVPVNLILVGRSFFPKKEQWEHWISIHEEQDSISRKIRLLQSLEAAGTGILIIQADATDEDQMRAGLVLAEERFGELHGVIYCAGPDQAHLLRTISATDQFIYEKHMQAKMAGVLVLERIVKGKKLDFCLVQSSLASILGGPGFAAYASANLFLDAFISKQRLESPVRWMSINWDGWQFEHEHNGEGSPGAGLSHLALTPQEGMEILDRIMSTDFATSLIVSTGNLHERIFQWVGSKLTPKAIRQQSEESTPAPQGTEQQDASISPRNEIEQMIADIWQDVLGVEAPGIYDNFMALGGHSLLAGRVLARLQEMLSIEISLQVFLMAPTIAGLAESAMNQLALQIGDETLNQLLDEMETHLDEDPETSAAQRKTEDMF